MEWTGTNVGTRVFTAYGWRANALLALGWMGVQAVLLGVRGPHLGRHTWLGYQGGIGLHSMPKRADTEECSVEEVTPGDEKAVEEAEKEATDASALAPARPPLAHRRTTRDRLKRPPLLSRRQSTFAAAAMGVLPAEGMTAAGLIQA
jgi:hypothetical protein